MVFNRQEASLLSPVKNNKALRFVQWINQICGATFDTDIAVIEDYFQSKTLLGSNRVFYLNSRNFQLQSAGFYD
jgi:hypothetical protein